MHDDDEDCDIDISFIFFANFLFVYFFLHTFENKWGLPLSSIHFSLQCSLFFPYSVPSSAFQEADLVSSKDSGHGDSEQGDSDHDATNRGHSTGKFIHHRPLFSSWLIVRLVAFSSSSSGGCGFSAITTVSDSLTVRCTNIGCFRSSWLVVSYSFSPSQILKMRLGLIKYCL